MNTVLKAAIGTAFLGAASVASATDFFLCPPSAGGGCTDLFEQMTTFIDSQSNYLDTSPDGGISIGDSVTDDGMGIVTGFQPSVFGTETQNYGVSGDWILNIAFSNLTQVVVAVDDTIGGDGDGIGQVGETVGVAAQILGGTIDIFYQDAGIDTLVAQLTGLSGSATIGDIVITGNVDFSNVAPADVALVQGLFFFDNGNSWYDVWAGGGAMAISTRFDTNIDQLLVQNGAAGFDFLRETDLDGSVRFDVPVPAPLALFGLGLLGLGLVRKVRS